MEIDFQGLQDILSNNLKNLTYFNLGASIATKNINKKQIKSLPLLPASLTALDLRDTKYGHEEAALLTSNLTNLQHLDITNNIPFSKMFSRSAIFLKNNFSNLKLLKLSYFYVLVDQSLAELELPSSLTSLDILAHNDNQIHDNESMTAMITNSELTNLS
jgi:hypothetical protein